MYRASLAAAVLGLGALLTFAPAQASPPQQSGVILAQWGPGGPPLPWAGGGRPSCWRLRRQLQQLYAMAESAPPWQRPGIQPGIRQTRMQLRYYCPGF
jgi:hypothetical protein